MARPRKPTVEVHGKDHVTWEATLNMLQAAGQYKIDTRLIQIPTEDNGYMAVVHSRCELKRKDDMMFAAEALGEAQPRNVGNKKSIPHNPMADWLIHMADTRARQRSAKTVLGLGIPSYEEVMGTLEDMDGREDDDAEEEEAPAPRERKAKAAPAPEPEPEEEEAAVEGPDETTVANLIKLRGFLRTEKPTDAQIAAMTQEQAEKVFADGKARWQELNNQGKLDKKGFLKVEEEKASNPFDE